MLFTYLNPLGEERKGGDIERKLEKNTYLKNFFFLKKKKEEDISIGLSWEFN